MCRKASDILKMIEGESGSSISRACTISGRSITSLGIRQAEPPLRRALDLREQVDEARSPPGGLGELRKRLGIELEKDVGGATDSEYASILGELGRLYTGWELRRRGAAPAPGRRVERRARGEKDMSTLQLERSGVAVCRWGITQGPSCSYARPGHRSAGPAQSSADSGVE